MVRDVFHGAVEQWQRLQALGARVIAVRVDRRAHLATVLIEFRDGSRAHAFGYTVGSALEIAIRGARRTAVA